ncbi:MAG: cysteine synthase A [Clostridiales bacterium]|nr:cysteine synthase A [Clostridiales bacterium]
MSNIYNSITELIGKTPIVRLNRIEKEVGIEGELLAKLDYFNPFGSSKDRIALEMIEQAEKDGRLKEGYTIIEGTSGNTGIALSAIAAAKGYDTTIVMPDNLSSERTAILKGFGAKVIYSEGKLNMAGAGAKVAQLAENRDDVFIPGQGGNPNNPGAHKKTTGPEIWEDTDGNVDIFIASVGTGGTITGAGEYLKEKKADIKIIGVEPEGCPLLSRGETGEHKIQGIGGGVIPPVLNQEIYDEIITVTDDDAYDYARKISRIEGISVGISSGAVLWVGIQAAKRPENNGKRIVLFLPDSGERYLSSGIFE